MLLLLQLATRRERQIIKDNREQFLFTMRDLRRLVQQMSPDGEFRQYEWRQLRRRAGPIINNFVAGFTETLMPELVALEAPVQEFAQDYADLEETSFIPQTEEQVLENVFIDQSKLPLLAYLIYNGRLATDLVNQIQQGCGYRSASRRPNRKIANDILRLTMRNGRVIPVVNTGSYANLASAQINNTLDGAVWGQINQNLKIGWRDVGPPVGSGMLFWTAKRVLFALHSTCKKVPQPPTFVSTGFSRTIPPVHPRCRCSILPVFT